MASKTVTKAIAIIYLNMYCELFVFENLCTIRSHLIWLHSEIENQITQFNTYTLHPQASCQWTDKYIVWNFCIKFSTKVYEVIYIHGETFRCKI